MGEVHILEKVLESQFDGRGRDTAEQSVNGLAEAMWVLTENLDLTLRYVEKGLFIHSFHHK